MSNILVIDGSYLLYKSFHSSKRMLNADGVDVSVAYKVLRTIINYVLRYEPTAVHFVMDVGRDLKKKTKYAKYKTNRDAKATVDIYKNNMSKSEHDRLELSRNIIINILTKTPIKVYAIPYIEGDTVCGGLAFEEYNNGNDVIILTGDKDYLQLVNDRISVTFLPHGKYRPIEETYTIDKIQQIWAVVKLKVDDSIIAPSPELIPYFRSLVGDTSDNISGVFGVGDKYVNKMLDIAVDNNITSFKNFNECVDFFKRAVNTIKEEHVKKSDKIRKIAEKLEDIICDEEKLNQWKVCWEISDIRHGYETLPPYALESLLSIYRDKKSYIIKDFLEEIVKYEFDSTDDYKKWVSILDCLSDGNWNNLQSRTGVGWYKMVNVFNIISEKVDRHYSRLENKQ